jgi:hypothetical protein
MSKRFVHLNATTLVATLPLLLAVPNKVGALNLLWTQEATIADIHAAIRSKVLTCRQLVQTYLDRIEAYDKKGPALNAIIVVNPVRWPRPTSSMLVSLNLVSLALSTASQ